MPLPTLIAGPLIRRVEPTTVTVWLVFSKKQFVQLAIWGSAEIAGSSTAITDKASAILKSDVIETIKIATNMHFAVITIDSIQSKLLETTAYAYNIYFGDAEATLGSDLGTIGLLHPPSGSDPEKFFPLGYTIGLLPTIAIPGENLENLRVIHGSCRKIHGVGDDAFRHVDMLLKKSTGHIDKRPQQLFLTGDQIYADEIPRIALPFINALGKELFGGVKELLVINATVDPVTMIPADMEHFPPSCRQLLVNETAKLTGNGIPSHLLSLQEYCATYLHYWSPDAWSTDFKLLLNKYKQSGYKKEVGLFHFYYLVNLLKNFDINSMSAMLFQDGKNGATSAAIASMPAMLAKLKTVPAVDVTPVQQTTIDLWKANYTPAFPEFDNIVKVMQLVESFTIDEQAALKLFFSADGVISESQSACDFLFTLPLARRVLANIPSYMICDDHEITDDWNFSEFWRNRVYTNSLGTQIIRNGLMAYAIFQDWGNVPAEYPYKLLKSAGEDEESKKKLEEYKNAFEKTKGDKINLLKKIAQYGTDICDGKNPEKPGIQVNDIDTLLRGGLNPTDPATAYPVRWHYDVPSGKAHTFFMDTRTRREYSDLLASPGLVSKEALDAQLPERIAELNYPMIFVISPVPALSLPVMEEFAQPLAGLGEGGLSKQGVGGAPIGAISGALVRDNEAWGFSEKHLEMLLDRLAMFKKVVILSGDIHFGYSSYADYWKQRKAENHARIIQLVSSPFKNAWGLDFQLLKSGFSQHMLTGFDYEFEKHGWLDKQLTVKGVMAPRHRIRLHRNPIVLPLQGWDEEATTDPAEPDWVWRLRIPADVRPLANIPTLMNLPMQIDKDLSKQGDPIVKADVIKTFNQMADRHNSLMKLGRNRRIVWQPHIGHIFFSKSADATPRFILNHEFYYTCRTDGFLNSDIAPDPDTAGVLSGAFTVHAINLDTTPEEIAPPKTLNDKEKKPATTTT